MLDLEQGSLSYYASRPVDSQWAGFLLALASELSEQMAPDDLRAFFRVLGQRWAREQPLENVSTLANLEKAANEWFADKQWGWVKIRDLQSAIEFQHSCAPLRQAFGSDALAWTVGVLEGLYGQWVRQLGGNNALIVRRVGRADSTTDTVRLRLADADHFA